MIKAGSGRSVLVTKQGAVFCGECKIWQERIKKLMVSSDREKTDVWETDPDTVSVSLLNVRKVNGFRDRSLRAFELWLSVNCNNCQICAVEFLLYCHLISLPLPISSSTSDSFSLTLEQAHVTVWISHLCFTLSPEKESTQKTKEALLKNI